jgi:hypothetical protein
MFWIAVAIGVIGAAVCGLGGVVLAFKGRWFDSATQIVPVAVMLPIWLLGVRIACEGAIVLFRIYEELRDGNEDGYIER